VSINMYVCIVAVACRMLVLIRRAAAVSMPLVTWEGQEGSLRKMPVCNVLNPCNVWQELCVERRHAAGSRKAGGL
jgi:hypothetical protein